VKNKIDSIIDDTDENFSSKVKKMNLIGVPFQIIIGKQTDGELLEFKEIGKETQKINLAEIINIIKEQKAKI
jgi:prolyl-tRNA synthetase